MASMRMTQPVRQEIRRTLSQLWHKELWSSDPDRKELKTAKAAAELKLSYFLRAYRTTGMALAAWTELRCLLPPEWACRPTKAAPYAKPEDLEYLTEVIVTRKIINATL